MTTEETSSPEDNVTDDAAVEHDHELSEQEEASAEPDTQATSGDDAPSIESLQEKLSQQADEVLRTKAEMQNVRRRAERDVEHARKYALEKFANDMLPIVDSLERGLDAVNEDSDDEAVKAMREGMVLTLKMTIDALKNHNVEQLDPVGEPFDPSFHEAMSMQPSAEAEPNSVLAVLQRGYTLNGRLIRPAMVVVSKAPE